MKFEAVRIHFVGDVFGLLSSKNFATMTTWRNDFSSLLKGQNRSGERYKGTWEARTGILNSKNKTNQKDNFRMHVVHFHTFLSS